MYVFDQEKNHLGFHSWFYHGEGGPFYGVTHNPLDDSYTNAIGWFWGQANHDHGCLLAVVTNNCFGWIGHLSIIDQTVVGYDRQHP